MPKARIDFSLESHHEIDNNLPSMAIKMQWVELTQKSLKNVSSYSKLCIDVALTLIQPSKHLLSSRLIFFSCLKPYYVYPQIIPS